MKNKRNIETGSELQTMKKNPFKDSKIAFLNGLFYQRLLELKPN